MKWLTADVPSATKLKTELTELLRAAHKLRFSTLAYVGMDVRWEVTQQGCRVWVTFWAEPEAELPF